LHAAELRRQQAVIEDLSEQLAAANLLLLLLAWSVKVQRRAAKGNGEWSRQATEKEKR
jgi:hypothetical protein